MRIGSTTLTSRQLVDGTNFLAEAVAQSLYMPAARWAVSKLNISPVSVSAEPFSVHALVTIVFGGDVTLNLNWRACPISIFEVSPSSEEVSTFGPESTPPKFIPNPAVNCNPFCQPLGEIK